MNMRPKEIVHELDRHIIGQQAAKRAVAIALRNRWRRLQLDEALRAEVIPKNILMIGPTGVGKTEVARRVAKLAGAPFIKVEATKFTEVGYVGRDVESIIRDLVENAVRHFHEQAREQYAATARQVAEEQVLDALMKSTSSGSPVPDRRTLKEQLRRGELDERDIEINTPRPSLGMEIVAPPGMEEMTSQLQKAFSSLSSSQRKSSLMKVKDALHHLIEAEQARLVNEEEVKRKALDAVAQTGIVFVDEIDKIAHRSGHGGADISREGVQRDLLPLIEGCSVNTRYGSLRTDHILFIASGAFHLSRPSDLIPELQGRLPIRVELSALQVDDFRRILTEPDASLIKQYQALMQTEGVRLEFREDAVQCLAEMAWQVNEQTENIGARRLHTVMEKLMDDISYHAGDRPQTHHDIDAAYVRERLGDMAGDRDLSHFVL